LRADGFIARGLTVDWSRRWCAEISLPGESVATFGDAIGKQPGAAAVHGQYWSGQGDLDYVAWPWLVEVGVRQERESLDVTGGEPGDRGGLVR